jgi:hypothetical protein
VLQIVRPDIVAVCPDVLPVDCVDIVPAHSLILLIGVVSRFHSLVSGIDILDDGVL